MSSDTPVTEMDTEELIESFQAAVLKRRPKVGFVTPPETAESPVRMLKDELIRRLAEQPPVPEPEPPPPEPEPEPKPEPPPPESEPPTGIAVAPAYTIEVSRCRECPFAVKSGRGVQAQGKCTHSATDDDRRPRALDARPLECPHEGGGTLLLVKGVG